MLVFSRRSIAALALLTGCVGVVGETSQDYQSGEDEATADPGDEAIDDDLGFDPGPVGSPRAVSNDVNACTKTREGPLVTGLHIREIALYQSVKVTLVKEGSWVQKRSAPVVAGKQALVRVFVDVLDGYSPRDVRAVLRIDHGDEPIEIIDERALTASSSEDSLASTFSFQVPGELLTVATKFSIALEELTCDDAVGAVEDARYPSSGSQTLEAANIGALKVVVVPVRVDGRVPLTSAAELAKMRSALLAYYPVPNVEVTARAPLDWPNPVEALDGAGWSNLLTQIMRERRSDRVDDDVYYFGLVQPAANFRTYCPRGCLLGLAPQTTSVMPNAQAGLGASFADAQTYETMVHELGHAHGRGHAPCVENGEIDGVDEDFPEPTGATSSWGWDSRSNELKPPSNKDIMGYCDPNWIGAYNYSGLASRSLQVNQKALRGGLSDERWQHVLLYADKTARWGGVVEPRMPSGNVELATALDARGNALEQVEVVRIPLSHSGDEFLYIPDQQPGWAALRLGDTTLVLDTIKPAL
jgi:hypothetical protein